jgi:hypothetical protein
LRMALALGSALPPAGAAAPIVVPVGGGAKAVGAVAPGPGPAYFRPATPAGTKSPVGGVPSRGVPQAESGPQTE